MVYGWQRSRYCLGPMLLGGFYPWVVCSVQDFEVIILTTQEVKTLLINKWRPALVGKIVNGEYKIPNEFLPTLAQCLCKALSSSSILGG